jgi:CRP-like cAMP-binding protein
LSEGEPAVSVFSLEKGAVRVFARRGQREVVLKLMRAPALFGEAEALSGLEFGEYVDVIETAEILIVPAEALLAFLLQAPKAAVSMLVDVGRRLAIAARNQKSLMFCAVEERLANYLLDYAAWTNDSCCDVERLELTQDEMAAALGVTRRAVAECVGRWQALGVLSRRSAGYLLCDRRRLSSFASPKPLRLSYSLADVGPLLRALKARDAVGS